MKVFKCVDKLYVDILLVFINFFCGKFFHVGNFKKFNENIFSQIPCLLENDFQPFEKFSWGEKFTKFQLRF
jgi:hypothetical protein